MRFTKLTQQNLGTTRMVAEGIDTPTSTFEVQAAPLPQLLETDEIPRVRLIKIDVEGAEGQVVRGMEPLLDQLHPDAEITVEVTPRRLQRLGDSADAVLETFYRHGYHAYRVINSHAAESYPSAIRNPAPPIVRMRDSFTEPADLIFSRIDAERLS